jgi:hypothetical protein
MILKAKHLYRVNFPENKYVLICPRTDVDLDGFERKTMRSVVSIDILKNYGELSGIYFGERNRFKFVQPSVSDVLELVNELKKHKSKFKYNLKTNMIEGEYDIREGQSL